MKKSLTTLLIIAMLACIGLVSCKNEVQVPAEELVSVSFENESSRALTASIEEFKPETYYWKYASKKADTSNLLSGQTSSYDEAGAQWIKEGQTGFGTTSGGLYTPFQVQGFSQGLWDFTLFAYNDVDGTQLVYSGEAKAVLIQKGGNHTVSAVVSPAGSGSGTLNVLVEEIKLDAAAGAQVVANARIKLGIKTSGSATYDVKTLDFVTENYTVAVGKGLYQVDIQFTNDDGLVVYASGSVIATVYSGLTTTVSGSLSEALSYAEFAATSDVIATTIGTANPILEGSTATDTIKLVKKSTTDPGKVSAELSNTTAQTLISDLKTAYGADSTEDSSLLLNLSVDTVEATETTIKYEIGMEAVLTYTKDADKKTTTSNVGEVADFVTVKIELQKGLENVEVRHSGELMTECLSLTELNGKQMPGPGATDAQKAEARKGYFFYDDVTDEKKATLYIRTYTFSPFALSYTVPKYVAAIGTKLYQSVAEAFSDVKANEVITLIDDAETGSVYTISSPLVLDKAGVVFDLNGKTLTVTGNFSLLISGNNDVVKNGTIQAGANSEKATGINSYAIVINGCDGAVLEDLVINGGVSFGGSTGDTPSAAAATNAVIRDCVVTSGDWYAVCAQQNSTVTIESGEYTANSKSTFSGTIQGTFVGTDGPKGTITVTGGVFNGQIKDNDKGDLVLKGGLYSVEPAEKYLGEGYGVLYDSTNEVWVVSPFNVIDLDDNKGYFLATTGADKGYLVGKEGKVPIDTYKGHTLHLLDSSLSNLVADTIDNFNAGFNWTVNHSSPDPYEQYFDGGHGTKIEPYLISNLNQWNSFYQVVYDWTGDEIPYFKLIDDIDCKGKTINNFAYDGGEKVYDFFMWFALNGDGHKILKIEDFAGYCQLFPYIWDALVCNITIDYNLDVTSTAAMVYYPVGDNYFTNVTTTGSIATTANWATAYVAYLYKAYSQYPCNVYYTDCINYANIKGGYGNNGYTAVFGSHNGGGGHITFDGCKNYGSLLGGYVGFVGMGENSAYTFVDSNAVKNYGTMKGTKNAGYFRYDSTDETKTIGGVTCTVKQEGSSAQKSATHSDSAPENFGDAVKINAVKGATKYEVQMSFSIQAYNYPNVGEKWSGSFPRSITRTYSASDVVEGKISTEFVKGYVGEIKADEYYGYGGTSPEYEDGVFVYSDFDFDSVDILLQDQDLYLVKDTATDKTFYVMYSEDYPGWYVLLSTNTSGEVTMTFVPVSFSVTAYNPDGSVLSFSSFSYNSSVADAKEYFNPIGSTKI